MAEGKWIGLTPTMPVAEAARHALEVRLEVVRDYLPLALHQPEKDCEYVHQLRVGTRRAGAALEIFADCLPEKVYQKARKQLRRVRRTAGEARDWDVFRQGLEDWRAQRTDLDYPGLDCLLGYVLAMRAAAQTHLRDAIPSKPYAFDRLAAEIVSVVRAPHPATSSQTLLDLAQPLLLGMLRELDAAASGNLSNYERLHQVRIAGKRLRYAMEVFADCFTLAFREELYPAVEDMQEILGRANDSHVAAQRLAALRDQLRQSEHGIWKRLKPGIDGFLRHHQRRLPQERQRFLKWWSQWQKTGGEPALVELLKTPASAASA